MKSCFALALAVFALTLGSVQAGEAEKGGGGGRRGGGLSPAFLERTLTGELALNEEQKKKSTEAYDKTVKPVVEKNREATDREAARTEIRAASETYKGELKTILSEAQFKKIEEVQAEMRKAREAKKNSQ